MVGCGILGCKSRSERKIDGVTFHSFPSDTETKMKWLEATGRQNWQPTKYSKICSIHFDDDSFIYKKKRVQLKPLQVPKKHIHMKSSAEEGAASGHDNALLTTPSTSRQDNTLVTYTADQALITEQENVPPSQLTTSCANINKPGISSIKRKKSVLQEVQNIQPKKLCLTASSNFDDILPALQSTSRMEKHLKKQLQKEQKKSVNRLKKLRAVRESKRRLIKKTANLENIIADLKCKIQMKSEELDLLSSIETENVDFLKRFLDKANCPRKYSASLRKFALCLHFISPKGYAFVRKQFNTCLPHPKTLYKWYKCINCEPGFTNEAFEAIKLIIRKSSKKLLCCISLDEMSIRQHLQWNGKQSIGYVNVGDNLDSDNVPLAKDALVFMVTAINDSWKIPVGYFLTSGVNGEQRSALLKTCINLLLECGLEIVSITFDGCPSNFAMAKNLGAQFYDINNINPEINVEGQNIVIIPDACHMLKLVRNTLADKSEILNAGNEIISWEYLDKLHNLQQNEGLHLANKLRNAHITFKKQIMKVRLAAQTFSNSVAESLLFCKNNLAIEDFLHSGATIEFIRYFNDIFDILNSRRLSSYGFKKPISKETFQTIDAKLRNYAKLC